MKNLSTICKAVIALFLFLNIIPELTKAQSLVKIIDLSVSTLISTDTTYQNDTTILKVIFKIKNKTLASKAHYLLGTAQDLGDVITAEGQFSTQGGITYITLNGSLKEVEGYNASAIFKLNNQQNMQFNYITVYVEDSTGQITDKLYFKK